MRKLAAEKRLALALRAAGLVHWDGRETRDPDENDAARLIRLGFGEVPAPAEGLDVERMARALHRTQTGHVPLDDLSCCRGLSYTEWAVDLAREYAALTPEDDHE